MKSRSAVLIVMVFALAACSAPATATPAQEYNPYLSAASATPQDYNPYLPSATSTPTLVPTATHPPLPNDYIVIAQLNLWFNGPGCHGGFEAFDCSGKRTTPLSPALGETYNSASQKVLAQQIDWAAQNGVDAFSLEWTTPREVPGSLEPNIDDAFLKAPGLYKIRWCIFYDFILRMMQTPELKDVDFSQGVNFDDPKVYDTFVADMVHFAKKYYSQPQYLKIDERPVIYLWSTWSWKGKYAEAIAEARQKVQAEGYDVFLVGDVIWANQFDPKLASQFDGSSSFTFLLPGVDGRKWKNVQDASVDFDRAYSVWSRRVKNLKVAGREDLVNVQPSFTPQFDNRLFDLGNPIYVPAESRDQALAMAQVAAKYAQPVGSQGWKLIWENTWNNWAETTTIEPTIDKGPKYPAGNYQFDMLEIIREVFGVVTFDQ
jgi:hypothetical protein